MASGSGSAPGTSIPKPSLKGCILAGGMGAWAGYLTPLNSAAGPMTMYTMRRYGVPLPGRGHLDLHQLRRARFSSSRSPGRSRWWPAPGRSLGQRGNLLGLSLYDLFLGSLTIVAGIGVLMAIVIFFPRAGRGI